jgi:cobalt/nickel transport system permease protein
LVSGTKPFLAKSVSLQRVTFAFALAAIFTGAMLSLFVSKKPDGLEWSIEKITGARELAANNFAANSFAPDRAKKLQQKTALMPDYEFKNADSARAKKQTSIAGFAGSVFTFALAGISALLISLFKKRKQKTAAREKLAAKRKTGEP